MRIDLLTKLAPNAIKAIGKKGVIEIISFGSMGAGATAWAIDKVVDAVVKPAVDKAKGVMESKKAELIEKRAAYLEQQTEVEKKEVIDVEPEEVITEEVPKKASKKKGK